MAASLLSPVGAIPALMTMALGLPALIAAYALPKNWAYSAGLGRFPPHSRARFGSFQIWKAWMQPIEPGWQL